MFALTAAVKDLRRYASDPVALLLWLGIPLVIGGLITLVTGGQGRPPVAHLLIADEDDSAVSGLLAGALNQQGTGGVVRGEAVRQDEGRRRIASDDGSALLVIPAGFGEAVLEETPAELVLVVNPAQRILPGIVEEGLEILVDGVFYLHRVLGDEIREMVDADPASFTEVDVARVSIAIHRAVQRLEKYLFPPVIELDVAVDEADEDEPDVDYGLLFFPGIILMALFFTAQGLSEDVWKEREQGTLRRAMSAPPPILALLAGKLLACVVVLAGISGAGLVLGMAYHRVSFALLPAALVWSALSGATLLLMMLLLQLHATSRRAGSILTNTVTFPLLMVGGSFFAFEAMPEWMAALGRLTPNGWALEQLKLIVLERSTAGDLLRATGLVLAFCVLAFAVCARRLRRSFAHR